MSKELVISAASHERRVAILEEGQLVEIYIEREKEFALVGSIYKGRTSSKISRTTITTTVMSLRRKRRFRPRPRWSRRCPASLSPTRMAPTMSLLVAPTKVRNKPFLKKSRCTPISRTSTRLLPASITPTRTRLAIARPKRNRRSASRNPTLPLPRISGRTTIPRKNILVRTVAATAANAPGRSLTVAIAEATGDAEAAGAAAVDVGAVDLALQVAAIFRPLSTRPHKATSARTIPAAMIRAARSRAPSNPATVGARKVRAIARPPLPRAPAPKSLLCSPANRWPSTAAGPLLPLLPHLH